MASIVSSRPRKKLRGRPKQSGTPKDPYQKATISWKVSQALVDYIEPELRPNETFSEATLRLLKEKGVSHAKAQKKLDALQEELREHFPEIESLVECKSAAGIKQYE